MLQNSGFFNTMCVQLHVPFKVGNRPHNTCETLESGTLVHARVNLLLFSLHSAELILTPTFYLAEQTSLELKARFSSTVSGFPTSSYVDFGSFLGVSAPPSENEDISINLKILNF